MFKKSMISILAISSVLTSTVVAFATPITLQSKFLINFKGFAVTDAESQTKGLERIVYELPYFVPSSHILGPRADSRDYTSEARIIYDSLANYLPTAETKKLHWMRFRFNTENYFRDIPNGHIGVGLRGGALADRVNPLNSYVRGNGITLGKNGICTSNRSIAIERFGNTTCDKIDPSCAPYMVIPGTCVENIFEDYKAYDIDLHVSQVGRTRWISYWVKDVATGALIAQVPPTPTNPAGGFYQDDNPYLDYAGDKTGWFIAHVDSNKNGDKSFSFGIRDFQVGVED